MRARDRRSVGILAALILLSACGKKKDGAGGKLRPAAVVPAPAPTDILADEAAKAPPASPEVLPAWATEPPHFFLRDGRRFASAVGRARVRDAALARATAEDRARVDLVRLLDGPVPDGSVQGSVSGARMTDTFVSRKDGQVFVRVEVGTTPG